MVVATGTASGKSLCYQLPIIDAAVRGTGDTALALFPTKALAQDQLRSLRGWLVSGLRAVTYDGDTPPDDRMWARKNATAVLTNPEMVHQAILPYHQRWSTFLMRLRIVVIDELHATRGIFGSHLANVVRRLRRVCAHYGSDPVFCFSSATIGNPAELASTMLGAPVRLIDDDGSPQAERGFAFWQRPLVDAISGARASANVETAELLARFVAAGHPTLAFTRSRRGAELVATHARRIVRLRRPDAVDRIAAYRAGYLPEERRALERKLSGGELLGIAATNALELGIDIGGLDAVVVNGFPGTLASLRQQIGRAGRTGRRAAAVLIAGDDQLDQWYARHPGELFHRQAEAAIVNPQNPFVLRPHVGCAAHELPLTTEDEAWFGEGLDDAVRALVQEDLLKPRGGKMYWAGRQPPAPAVGLRSGTSAEFTLVDEDLAAIGTVDGARIFSVAHPGAIYLHQGRQWRVERLDVDAREAHLVDADDADEYTQPRETTDIEIRSLDAREPCGAGHVHLGMVEVTNQVVAYQRKRASTHETIETVPLDVPPRTLVTQAIWYTAAAPVLERARRRTAPGPRCGARGRARHDRDAAAVRDLRPLGRRRRLDGDPSEHRSAHDLRVRRLLGRGRNRRAGLRRRSRARARDRRARRGLPVRGRLPVVRPVTEVRQLERVPRQGGGGAPARRAARADGRRGLRLAGCRGLQRDGEARGRHGWDTTERLDRRPCAGCRRTRTGPAGCRPCPAPTSPGCRRPGTPRCRRGRSSTRP